MNNSTYDVVVCADSRALTEAVNQYLRQGWELLGGVSVCIEVNPHSESGRADYVWVQAIVKSEPQLAALPLADPSEHVRVVARVIAMTEEGVTIKRTDTGEIHHFRPYATGEAYISPSAPIRDLPLNSPTDKTRIATYALVERFRMRPAADQCITDVSISDDLKEINFVIEPRDP